MGHLINPIAMRMGWSSNWVDVFFSDSKYYPFYLHLIFRLRLILVMLFDAKWFENAGFFYSHFLLIKTYNGLAIQIYFYDGVCESFVYYLREHVREDKESLKTLTTWKNFHEKKRNKFWTFYLFLVIFYMINKFRIFDFPNAFLNHYGSVSLSKAFFKYNYKSFQSILKLNVENKPEESLEEKTKYPLKEKGKLYKIAPIKEILYKYRGEDFKENREKILDKLIFVRTRMRLFYFYALCRTMALKDMEYDENEHSLKPNDLLKDFLIALFALSRNNFIFGIVSLSVYYLTNYLCYTDNRKFLDHCTVGFFIISNDHITAKFISRYIARKLQQGFTIRSLMNPLLKEFRRLCAFGTHGFKRTRTLFETFARRMANRTYFSSLFRALMTKLHGIYKNENYPYVQKNKTFISFDIFLFLKFAYKTFPNSYKNVIALCKKYISSYFSFVLINYYKTFELYRLLLDKLLYTTQPLIYFNAQRFFLHFLPRIAYSMPCAPYETYLNWDSLTPIYYKKILVSSFLLLFNKKMHAVYGKYHHAYENYVREKKNRLLRNPDLTWNNLQPFLGFKVQFLGRFTRRQRSAKLTWLYGKVPATNISSLIEYADYNVILVNSLVNVKVWFNKSIHFVPYVFKLM